MTTLAFDPDTGEVLDEAKEVSRLRAENAKLREQVELLEGDAHKLEIALRTERRKNTELTKKLHEEQESDPRQGQARELFDYWVHRTKRSTQRTKFDRDRMEKVLTRLKEYDYEQVKAAIDGAVADPFTRGTKKYDDLKTICKNAQVFEEMRDRGYAWRKRHMERLGFEVEE